MVWIVLSICSRRLFAAVAKLCRCDKDAAVAGLSSESDSETVAPSGSSEQVMTAAYFIAMGKNGAFLLLFATLWKAVFFFLPSQSVGRLSRVISFLLFFFFFLSLQALPLTLPWDCTRLST